MPEFFRQFLRFIETCQLKSKTEPIEINQIQSRPTIFDEKVFNDPIDKEPDGENEDSEAAWAKFHMYSNWLTFAVQFTAVTLTQGKTHSSVILQWK